MEQKIGRYTLTSKLGHGGMGEVFLAAESHAKNAEQVVIKRILPQNAANSGYKKLFLSEMELIAHFRHDNVVALKDHGYDGEYYIVLEYVGPDLGELIRRARDTGVRIPPALCAKMISLACAGLHYIHQQRIVHYDISPENLAISRAGIVKILDFGISRTEDQTAPPTGRTPRKKLAYMAPERVGTDGQADWRVDIYALGVLFYELLSGCRPYESDDEVDEDKDPFKENERRLHLRRLILNKEPITPLRDIDPDIPEELERIVERALAADPTGRYQSCHEMGVELERFVASSRPPITPADLPEWVERIYPRKLTEIPAPTPAPPLTEAVTAPPSEVAPKESGNPPARQGPSFAEMALSIKHPWQIIPFAIGVIADIFTTKWLAILASVGMYMALRVFEKWQNTTAQPPQNATVPSNAGSIAGAKVTATLKLPLMAAGNALPNLAQLFLPVALGIVVAEGAKTINSLHWPSEPSRPVVVDTEPKPPQALTPLPDTQPQQVSEIPDAGPSANPPTSEQPPPAVKVRFRLNMDRRSLKYCNIKGVGDRVNPEDLVLAGSQVECSYSCEDELGNGTPRKASLTVDSSHEKNLPCP